MGAGGTGFGATDGTAATTDLLGRLLTGLEGTGVPPRALRARGSLAGGDCQEGRGDPDLIAVPGRPCAPDDERRPGALRQRLQDAVPLAAGPHCGYLAVGAAVSPGPLIRPGFKGS
ncbi:hypothetical protein [Streptomyces albospinus]|uniref:hypothetical protein n=1 Tax=Streptomyces albospinus TaxID=285515 RepID=UPI001670007A|nr:hypothetical protein [Streptomyces albospinus]